MARPAKGLSCRGVDLPLARPRRDDAVDRRRRGMDHARDHLRPLLLVSCLLRRPGRGVRMVAWRHRGGVLALLCRSGIALAGRRTAGGPPRPSARDPRRSVPARWLMPALESDRIARIAL